MVEAECRGRETPGTLEPPRNPQRSRAPRPPHPVLQTGHSWRAVSVLPRQEAESRACPNGQANAFWRELDLLAKIARTCQPPGLRHHEARVAFTRASPISEFLRQWGPPEDRDCGPKNIRHSSSALWRLQERREVA